MLHMMKSATTVGGLQKSTVQKILHTFERAPWTADVQNLIAVAVVLEQCFSIFDNIVHSEAFDLTINDIFKISRGSKTASVAKNRMALKKDVCFMLRNLVCTFPAWGIFGPACAGIVAYARAFLEVCTSKTNVSWFASHVVTSEGRDFIANHSALASQSFKLLPETQDFIKALASKLTRNNTCGDVVLQWCANNYSALAAHLNALTPTLGPIEVTFNVNKMFRYKRTRLFSDTFDAPDPRSFSAHGELPFTLVDLRRVKTAYFDKRLHCAAVQSTSGSDLLATMQALKLIVAEFSLSYLNGGERKAKSRRREFSSVVSPHSNADLDSFVLDPLWRHTHTFTADSFASADPAEIMKCIKTAATRTNGLSDEHISYLVPAHVDNAVAVNTCSMMVFCIGIHTLEEQLYSVPAIATFVCVVHVRRRTNTKTVGYGMTGVSFKHNFIVFCDDKMEHNINVQCKAILDACTQFTTPADLLLFAANVHARVSSADKPCSLVTTIYGVREAVGRLLQTPDTVECANLCASVSDADCKKIFLWCASDFWRSSSTQTDVSALHRAIRLMMQEDLLLSQQFLIPRDALCALPPTFNMFDAGVIALSEKFFGIMKKSRIDAFIDSGPLCTDATEDGTSLHNLSDLDEVTSIFDDASTSPENVLPPV